MGNWILNFIANHHQYVEGAIIGAVISNPGWCATALFNGLVKIPGVGTWIGKNPDKAKEWADSFDKTIDQLVTQYAADHAAAAPTKPAA